MARTHAEDDEVSRQIRKLQSMEETDGEVLVFNADIADPAQMDELLVQLQTCWANCMVSSMQPVSSRVSTTV